MGEDIERLTAFAREAVREHGITGAQISLLNVSENATFKVEGPEGLRFALRVHRTGYHSGAAIESELAWVRALREDGVVRTPPTLATPDGRHLVVARHPEDGEERYAVAFAWVNGIEPPEDRLVADFEQLGAITARLHHHARRWAPPPGFTRFTWDFDTSLGDSGHWGRWQDGMAMGPDQLAILGRCAQTLRRRLEAFGKGPDRFGLIHADMRLANLLVDGDQVSVIDFDDCGFSWYLYDLGSSLSFIEDHPLVPELIDAWARGYRQVAPLSAEEEGELRTFVMMRRLLLVAWIGSHAATDLAQDMGAQFTTVSCELAETYLSSFG